MIIGLDTIGNFPIQSNLPTSFDNNFYLVEIKNAIVDEIYISKDGDITDTSKKDWVLDTFLNAKFLGDLEAGNVGLGNLPIDKWKIRRRNIDSTSFKELDVIDMGIDENFYYLDTSPRSNVVYEYEVIPMSGDIEGIPHTIQILVEFDYWWLSDIDTDECYPLFANLEVSEITQNTQRILYEGFNEFPIVAYGTQKYASGTITAILLDSFFQTSKNYRDQVESFINNKKRKYLKSPKGDVWIVDTHSSRRKPYTNVIDDISTITFDWTEVDKYTD